MQGFHFWMHESRIKGLSAAQNSLIIRCFVGVLGDKSSKSYCKSGAQNDHIIFLIHVVSAPLPSLSSCKRNEGLLEESLAEGPQNRGLLSPFFSFNRLDRGEILFDNRRHLMTNGIDSPLCHRRGRPKMALITEHSRTMTVRARN